jgi:hypothetical protein
MIPPPALTRKSRQELLDFKSLFPESSVIENLSGLQEVRIWKEGLHFATNVQLGCYRLMFP